MAFKYRLILVVVGLLIVLTGLYPLLSNFALMQNFQGLPEAGTKFYQAIIIFLGVIAIGYGLQGPAKRPMVHQK